MPWDTEAGAGCLEWARACAMSPGTTYTYQLRAACAIAVMCDRRVRFRGVSALHLRICDTRAHLRCIADAH